MEATMEMRAIEKRLLEGYEMGYVFGLREGLSPVAQATRC
ncbi:Conserved hypothetical protein [Prochlorococcus marinus str. MIT 9313]|uniref:Uncharacterized protein n=1 Tax=Prochlorococcus marinus (strain MIT 9313) TaxID=74547 RepID=B9ESF4_PROMM|nr:Conserved hypothetical protein [Prochlorococcus marinus str. MIT 9313]